jgi:tRNA A37 threonylcarbamoyladenosine dehydratase
VAEALARSGVGALDLVDHDTISLTNLNRQILATRQTVGMDKAEAAAQRVKSINPDCDARAIKTFYLPETADQFDFTRYDYVVDAVDTVTAKIEIILQAQRAGVPVVSSMGAGNKLDPSAFEVADIYKTSVDPLARVMRRELKKRGVKKLKVVYSKEVPIKPLGQIEADPEAGRKDVPGSSAFTPSAAGLLIASEVVKDLIGWGR